ncbi:hypothetical protein H0H81_012730 [Sphagnurus paluster]|uniref:Uncharacterized protein n=1 Tax=Sphagnurus paluster TaxID=117069 RepID=A0A9P7GHR9_9AGAR|nr:hypothetical protein H0H81_012730 [Sphagnurus paluster]
MFTSLTAPTYDSVVQTMLQSWEEFPQHERIDFYQKAAKAFADDQTQKKAKDILSEMGSRVVAADKAMRDIAGKLSKFAVEYEKQYPSSGFRKEYAEPWMGIWRYWGTAIVLSRDIAESTAKDYKDSFLPLLESASKVNLDDPENVKQMKQALESYSKTVSPTPVPSEFEDSFAKLKLDVTKFQKKFQNYLKVHGHTVSAEVQQLQDKLNKLDDQLETYFMGSGYLGQVHDSKVKMDEANKKQPPGLPHMYTGLDSVDRELYMVQETLACLTQTWSDMRSTSIQFIYMLGKAEKYRKVDEEEFKLALELAKGMAQPLIDGLLEYVRVFDEAP